jgi:hypothetical protein
MGRWNGGDELGSGGDEEGRPASFIPPCFGEGEVGTREGRRHLIIGSNC